MKTSQRGIDLIKEFEGLYLHDYDDGVGVRTIGYGHTDAAGPPKVTRGMTITKREAEDILRADLGKVEKQVNDLVKVPITQNQFDALVSFHFNTGGLGRSSALRSLNAGNYKDVPSLLLLWNKGGGKVMAGLVRRRKAEGGLFNSTLAAAPKPPDIPKPEPKPAEPENIFVRLLKFIFWKRG